MTKAYSATDPGVLFDMYAGKTEYPIPGPKVWDGASSGSAPAPSNPQPTTTKPATTPAPSKTATPTAAPAPTKEAGNGNGSTLPETFTIEQFITWLKSQAGGSKARRHARAF